jgi:hypothetical protein
MPIQVDNSPLKIKLITDPEEIAVYSDLITRHHYLGSSQVNRNTIMHVVRRGRHDVAVLTWERNVRRWFGLRDRLIGWTKSQKEQRCNYCIENRRFLMLCDEKNLASQVLSESMNRICEDANLVYGHDVMLAETFVDVARGLQGTCYRAQGWTEVGLTQGGRGTEQRSQKLYFVKELKVDALAKLKAPELAPSDTSNPRQKVLSLQQLNLTSLRKKLDVIPDYRKHKGWYPMTSIYALLIVAVLSGETTAKGIWRWISGLSHEYLKSLGCRQAPSYSKVWNTLTKLDHNALEAVLCSWLTEQTDKVHLDKNIKILSIDGKALKSASKAADNDLHVLTLIDTITKVIRAQRPVGEKTNEIPVAQELLKDHPLDASMIITADAMHTQDNLAEVIQKKMLITSFPSRIIN